ncbi:MAG: transposase [Clostridia bacterium]|nr:transposase [Clostridia bacterium]
MYDLKKEFNSIKKEKYPFVCEVSKYASQEPFMDFKDTLTKFYERIRNKEHVKLRYKSKKDVEQSFYIGGDQVKKVNKEGIDKDYLKMPKMMPIKLSEKLRFKGHIVGCRIIKKFNKYYAAISVDVQNIEKKDTKTNKAIGIDLGIKNHITLSNGLVFNYPSSVDKIKKRIKIVQKQLSRKVHPRTKDDPKIFSNNYLKMKKKLDKLYDKMRNIMIDYERKVSNLLTKTFSSICIENLNIQSMKKNHNIAKQLQTISFYRLRKFVENKMDEYNTELVINNRYFPSSKTCSRCGNICIDLKLSNRVYRCKNCGLIINRDVNAAINLVKNVGRVTSEFTPLDLKTLINDAKLSKINVFNIEEGK